MSFKIKGWSEGHPHRTKINGWPFGYPQPVPTYTRAAMTMRTRTIFLNASRSSAITQNRPLSIT